MDAIDPRDLLGPFNELDDPRAHNIIHPFANFLLIAIMAVICGAQDWQAVAQWGRAKRSWLATFLDLSRGVPSHDSFGRVFAMIDPEALERCFMQWAGQLVQSSGGQLIAIDGKTLRRSFDAANNKAAIHMVSAWSTTNALTLGQLTTDAKSNEITAIPKLLELLDLKGATVTIDAMGCQKNIAQQIVEQGGDYLLQVKANHKTLHEEVKLLFDEADNAGFEGMSHARHETIEKDHGRIETRRLDSTWDIGWFKDRKDWAGLKSFVRVRSTRQVKGKTSVEDHYYLSSLDGRDAQSLLAAARGHWGVENQLHWSLDMSFREDERRVRQGHAAENFSRLCRIALNLLRAEKTLKLGIANKRLNCGWDHDYLLKVLMNLG